MASKPDLAQLEEDNRALVERIAGLEDELSRRDELLKETVSFKDRFHSESKEGQKRIKELLGQIEELEDSEFRAKSKLILHNKNYKSCEV